jgi:hypothetical protein
MPHFQPLHRSSQAFVFIPRSCNCFVFKTLKEGLADLGKIPNLFGPQTLIESIFQVLNSNSLFKSKLSLVWISKSCDLNPWSKVQILIFEMVQALDWISKSVDIFWIKSNLAAKIFKRNQNPFLISEPFWHSQLIWPGTSSRVWPPYFQSSNPLTAQAT